MNILVTRSDDYYGVVVIDTLKLNGLQPSFALRNDHLTVAAKLRHTKPY